MDIRQFLSAAFLALALAAFGNATAQNQSAGTSGEIRGITQEIAHFSEVTGVQITDAKFEPGSRVGDVSPSGTSCTVSIPGGTGVTVSATAPTCLEAWPMVRAAIAEMI